MEEGFVLALITATSAGAWAVGAGKLGLSSRALGSAFGRMLESVGLIAVFFAVNLLVGGLAILAARAVGSGFLSLYLVDDVTVLGLSILQGLAFQAWREAARRQPPADRRP